MKQILALSFVCLIFTATFAQDYKTGNTEFDASLTMISTNAKSDMIGFRAQMKSEYQISDSKFDYMSVKLGMRPGDIYFALEIGKYSKKPIDEILLIYKRDKGRGWGEIAKNCGIKPGSPAFHAMKSNAGNKAKKGKGPHHKGPVDNKNPNYKNNPKDGKGGKTSMPDYKTGNTKNANTGGDKKSSTGKSSKTNPDYKKK